MFEHLSSTCAALDAAQRQLVSSAFHTIDRRLIERGKRHRIANKNWKDKHPPTEEQMEAHRTQTRQWRRQKAAALKGRSYEPSDDERDDAHGSGSNGTRADRVFKSGTATLPSVSSPCVLDGHLGEDHSIAR